MLLSFEYILHLFESGRVPEGFQAFVFLKQVATDPLFEVWRRKTPAKSFKHSHNLHDHCHLTLAVQPPWRSFWCFVQNAAGCSLPVNKNTNIFSMKIQIYFLWKYKLKSIDKYKYVNKYKQILLVLFSNLCRLLPAVTQKHDFIPNITNTITKNIYNTYKKLKSKYKFW